MAWLQDPSRWTDCRMTDSGLHAHVHTDKSNVTPAKVLNVNAHAHTRTRTHTQTQTQRHRHRHTETETQRQRHRHRHTQTHTDTHTHTHNIKRYEQVGWEVLSQTTQCRPQHHMLTKGAGRSEGFNFVTTSRMRSQRFTFKIGIWVDRVRPTSYCARKKKVSHNSTEDSYKNGLTNALRNT